MRANAIESLWSAEGPFAAACFYSGLQDSHQRVVGNSFVGLYLQGDPEGVSGLAEMAGHSDPLFRAAGAWAMGRTGDARFVEILRQMRRNPQEEQIVLRNALQSIGRINQATNALQRDPVRLSALSVVRLDNEQSQVTVIVRDPGFAATALRPPD